MQTGSLITPSKMLLDAIADWLAKAPQRFEFVPKVPERGEIYVCEYIYDFLGEPNVKAEGFYITLDKKPVHLDMDCWDELQPPMEVDIEQLMPEEAFVGA